jgi:hypothetical protein
MTLPHPMILKRTSRSPASLNSSDAHISEKQLPSTFAVDPPSNPYTVDTVSTISEPHPDPDPNKGFDTAQHIAKRHTATRHVKAWLPELLCLFGSIGLFIAIIVILAHYDNTPLSTLPLDLTINTIVALLATLCRATLIIAISEGLSQLKWNTFALKQRALRDLEVFDQASRGPWGSIRMVVATRGRYVQGGSNAQVSARSY